MYCNFAVANSGMNNFNYLQRLMALEISSLGRRRLERDLILCYNLFHGICEIHLPFKLGVSVTRGNSCKLVKSSCNTYIHLFESGNLAHIQ